MEIDFDNLQDNTIQINEFKLKWRFTDEADDKLSDEAFQQLKPLNITAAGLLSDFIMNLGLHDEIPFRRELFNKIDHITISDNNSIEIQEWLNDRGIPLEKFVFLSWTPDTAMIVPYKILIKYFNSFYYSSSDDLTIIDDTLNWALVFLHYDEIYFGCLKR